MEAKRVVVYSSLIVIIVLVGYLVLGHFIDKSQTVEQAKINGSPGVSSLWRLNEYKRFNKYLVGLSKDEDYPMLSSPKSAKLFEQLMVSMLSAPASSLGDGKTLINTAKLRSVIQSICILYIQKNEEVNKYGIEISHLRGMQIRLLLDIQILAKNIIVKVAKDDVNYLTNLKGISMLQEGASIQIIGFAKILGQSDYINQNRVLLDYFRTYVPELLTLIDMEKRKEIKQNIIEASNEVSIDYIKKILYNIGSNSDL